MMKISVLISVYKSEKADYLNKSLESVWNEQTLRPNQIILIEDGPLTADLYEVIEKWKGVLGDVLTILTNSKNLGLTKSLNLGITHVSGDVIARMDSDDISDPRRFERQVAYLEQHPDVDIVGGSLQEFDEENPCLNVRHYPLTHEEACKYIVKACPLAHPSVMMRRSIFDEGLKYDERYRMSQDIKLWYDAILAGYKISNIQEVVLFFRRDGDVFKRRSRAKAWNEFCIYMNGIYRMKGLFTLSYIYPISRYCFRNLPPIVVKWIYGSRMRKKVLENSK